MSENTENRNSPDLAPDVNRITAATTDAQYQAADADLLAAEQEYAAFERSLAEQLRNVERDYPSYHEYRYDIATIGHDPYVLMAILCAIKPDFAINDLEIRETMKTLKQPRRQYTLTITPDQNNISILNVKLTNYGLNCIPDSILSHGQLCAYAGYLRSHGQRPDLFPTSQYPQSTPIAKPRRYTVADKLRQQYPLLNRELAVAEQYVGYPYVWSGSEPDTSFDCSGFITYVVNQIGYKHDRTTAQGIYDYCTPVSNDDKQPGDLIFFRSPGAKRIDHAGIYVGADEFLHSSPNREESCVHYSNLSGSCLDKTWRDYLVGFARIK